MLRAFLLFLLLGTNDWLIAQDHNHPSGTNRRAYRIEPQPFLAQALRLQEALSFLGSSLNKADVQRLQALQHLPLDSHTIRSIQDILDPYCLAMVNINPEARVKVERGPATAALIQGGWVSFLVKVENEAGVTAQLQVESPNAAPPLYPSSYNVKALEKNRLSPGQVAARFLELQLYRNRPLLSNLSGLALEYTVLQVYCKEDGLREAEIGFHIGQGTQDIGFRNTVPILFHAKPSVNITLHVKDEDGSPAMASFVISDGVERILDDSVQTIGNAKFRLAAAQLEYRQHGPSLQGYKVPARLVGIYPLPARRVAAYDPYPDFFFQPQIYRQDGEQVSLPPGTYTVSFSRGPEYISQTMQLLVPEGISSFSVSFRLKRWIHLSKLGWYSADHHIHGAGCSHYESPEEGVLPSAMFRQALGEDLNIAAILAWGPGWYHQKTFFTGQDHPLSTPRNLVRSDVEVSGFPSSHAGHLVLLRLKEDDYPGTTQVEDWPSWTGPVLNWAKAQNGVTGYAHSGWGLEPVAATKALPNYVLPKMDGIGANEYVVTVTQNLVDFYSAGDTPAPWELNMWYHTLNAGFTTRLSGETDFPCIFDERVGLARSYFKPEGKLSYDGYVAALQKGRSYISDGRSHIIDFTVNETEAGTGNSRVELKGTETVQVKARVAAYLPEVQDEAGKIIAGTSITDPPYWHLERARIGTSRKAAVELIVNGMPVDTMEINADGRWQDLSFSYPVQRSSWMALRIYPSAHTNPVFITVNGQPIREPKSAAWCKDAVDQCWKMKQNNIRPEERPAAEAAYQRARELYNRMAR